MVWQSSGMQQQSELTSVGLAEAKGFGQTKFTVSKHTVRSGYPLKEQDT